MDQKGEKEEKIRREEKAGGGEGESHGWGGWDGEGVERREGGGIHVN